jgi:hypothetical protein
MSTAGKTPLCIVGAIVERGKGQKLFQAFEKKFGVLFSYRISGEGTASSDLLDILGIGTAERDILLSPMRRDQAAALVEKSHNEGLGVHAQGILFVMPLTAGSAKVALALQRDEQPPQEEEKTMAESKKQSLIIIAVDQGYTEAVMNTAKSVGARGGTVVRSHILHGEQAASYGGPTFAGEREIVAIVASQSERNAIMEKVDEVHGGQNAAHAILYSLPIEMTAHLS